MTESLSDSDHPGTDGVTGVDTLFGTYPLERGGEATYSEYCRHRARSSSRLLRAYFIASAVSRGSTLWTSFGRRAVVRPSLGARYWPAV